MRRPRPAFLFVFAAAATTLTPLAGRAAPAATVAAAVADAGPLEDPNADRGFLLPTALTQPKNTFTITDYEILLLGLTYGITDRLQIGATTLLAGGGFLADRMVIGNLKWQFLRAGKLRLAAMAGVQYTSNEDSHGPPGEGGGTETTRLRPHTGLSASYCLDVACHSLVSANAIGYLTREYTGQRTGTVLYSAGGTLQLSDHWKMLLEYSQSVTFPGDDLGSDPTVSIGFRLFGRHLAAEAGVMLGIDDDGGALPIPFLSASARL